MGCFLTVDEIRRWWGGKAAHVRGQVHATTHGRRVMDAGGVGLRQVPQLTELDPGCGRWADEEESSMKLSWQRMVPLISMESKCSLSR